MRAMLLLLSIAAILVSPTASDPQTYLLNSYCSQYRVNDNASFLSYQNTSFADLRSQLAAAPTARFATATVLPTTRAANPVYALFQCRPYLSSADCLSCLAASVAKIRTCGAANGARATYDGCFLRYESVGFFDQGTEMGNIQICDSNATDNTVGFNGTVGELMRELSVATARIDRYFAAAERDGVYGVAQCAETVSEGACAQCLGVALANIEACPPDSDGRAIDAGCFMRYSNRSFFPANQTVDLSSYLTSGSSSHKGAIIGGVAGVVCGLLVLGLVVFLWIRRSKKPWEDRRGDILGATELRGPMNFHYKDLKSATKNFSEVNKLGEGGFGDVYKGVLRNGKIVAVKKLAIAQTSRAKADFQSEVKLISNVHHRNLVRLLGCSSKGMDMLLVYEYMANSSLDKFLFGNRRGSLNWKQRFDIIVGMARGLAYLHQEFHVCIIHRDIKSSNILLDDDFQPRIADFGLARLLPGDQSHVSTRFAGTLGYTAPEYAIQGKLSEKVDTYSYGVVVLEVISGRKSNDISLEPINQYLLEWAWALYENRSIIELVDKSLDPEEYDPEEVSRAIDIALLCTQSSAAERPTMSEIVLMLLSKGVPLQEPTRPTFIDVASNVRGDKSTSTGAATSSSSNATVSITQFSAR